MLSCFFAAKVCKNKPWASCSAGAFVNLRTRTIWWIFWFCLSILSYCLFSTQVFSNVWFMWQSQLPRVSYSSLVHLDPLGQQVVTWCVHFAFYLCCFGSWQVVVFISFFWRLWQPSMRCKVKGSLWSVIYLRAFDVRVFISIPWLVGFFGRFRLSLRVWIPWLASSCFCVVGSGFESTRVYSCQPRQYIVVVPSSSG